MGIFDKAKDALSEHKDKVDEGVAKAGDLIDEKTDGKYAGQVDKGEAMAKERLADYASKDDAPVEPGPEARPV